jgi:hypothetical protein
MAKHIQISVDNPCHENWENMSASEKGRFCGSCQKQVVDFTGMSDSQVAAFFKKPSTGNVCGRFMADQLERDIEIPRKRIPWVKYFFQVALPAFLVSRGAAQETKNQLLGEPTVTCQKPVLIMGKIMQPKVITPAPPAIKGFVVDQSGTPIEGATVNIKGTNSRVATDKYGFFEINNATPTVDMVLVSTVVGYMINEVKVPPGKRAVEIKMELSPEIMGAVVIVGYGRVKKKSTIPLIGEMLPDSTAKFAKAFPNPVIAGDLLTIQCKNLAKGDYTIELLNGSGQMVQHKELRIENVKPALQLKTPQVRPGAYYLKITNKATRKSVTDKVVIQ